jgi:hypothetical protein
MVGNYPLTPLESGLVNWAGRVITALAVAALVLLGTIAVA